MFADLHRGHGVDLRLGAAVTEEDVRGFDAVVVGIGATPDTALAEAAGLDVDDGVLVDEFLRTPDPYVFAIGDIAAHQHPVLGRRVRVEHWDTAKEQAKVAAHNILGREERYDRLPYFFTDQYDLGMEYVGSVGPDGYDRVDVEGSTDVLDGAAFRAFWVKDWNRRRGDARPTTGTPRTRSGKPSAAHADAWQGAAMKRQVPKPRDLAPLLRFRRPVLSARDRRLASALTIEDLRRIARRRTPKAAFDYTDGAADGEVSLARARQAFADVEFHPSVLRDVSSVDTGVEVLGQRSAMPFGIAPTGFTRLMQTEGETAGAGAAGAAGIPFTLSTLGTTSIEDVAAAAPGARRWFQLYMWKDRDRSMALVDRAWKAGFDTLLVTVDVPVAGARLRDVRNGMTIPPTLTPRTVLNAIPRPAWWFNFLTTEPLAFASLDSWSGTVAELLDHMFDPTVTYADLRWLREQWPGKLSVKGVQTVADAARLAEVGVDAIVLSNHGGRQLDRAPVPFRLPSVVREVGDDLEGAPGHRDHERAGHRGGPRARCPLPPSWARLPLRPDGRRASGGRSRDRDPAGRWERTMRLLGASSVDELSRGITQLRRSRTAGQLSRLTPAGTDAPSTRRRRQLVAGAAEQRDDDHGPGRGTRRPGRPAVGEHDDEVRARAEVGGSRDAYAHVGCHLPPREIEVGDPPDLGDVVDLRVTVDHRDRCPGHPDRGEDRLDLAERSRDQCVVHARGGVDDHRHVGDRPPLPRQYDARHRRRAARGSRVRLVRAALGPAHRPPHRTRQQFLPADCRGDRLLEDATLTARIGPHSVQCPDRRSRRGGGRGRRRRAALPRRRPPAAARGRA